MRVHSRLENFKENYETYGIQMFLRDISHDQDEYLLPSESSEHKVDDHEQTESDDGKIGK